MLDPTLRLHTAISAACPIVGISIGLWGDSTTVTFFPAAGALPGQIAAAQGIVNAFDWSDAAEVAFENTQARAAAVASLADPAQTYKLLRALMLVILDEVNLIRSLLVPAQAPRTAAQLRTAIQNKLSAGSADN